jgi:hypothetical protein
MSILRALDAAEQRLRVQRGTRASRFATRRTIRTIRALRQELPLCVPLAEFLPPGFSWLPPPP